MNKAKEKVLKFIKKNISKEKEKYADGRKHNLFEWKDLLMDFERINQEQVSNSIMINALQNKINRLEQILNRYGIRDR